MPALAQRVLNSCTLQPATTPVPILRFAAHVGQVTVGGRCATECVMNEQIEEWRAIKGYEGYYEVSSHGRVRSLDRVKLDRGGSYVLKGKIMSNAAGKHGYSQVALTDSKGKPHKHLVHRLMMMSFSHTPIGKTEVNHKNGIKTDNVLSNLEWVSPAENSRHAWATGLAVSKKGSENCRAKLQDSDIPAIRFSTETLRVIAKRYGIGRSAISAIKLRKSWKHIP